MKFEIISEEFIKPSSPTPQDLKIHNYSLMDQIVPPFFAPMIFYYPNLGNELQNPNTSISRSTEILKQSLSSTLTLFYPLAGRIRDDLSVDCNDEGVLFIITKFQENLSEFLKNPNPNADVDHIPHQLTWDEPRPGDQVAKVQVNHYACGGIVIGLVFYHKLADGISMSAFMKDWAAKARGDLTYMLKVGSGPTLKFHSMFPHNPEMKRDSHLFTVMRRYFNIGRPVIRRYVFDAEAISALRAQIAEPNRPSRVEVVTSVMWKYFMTACAAVNDRGPPKTSLISHVINMRKKVDPPFLDSSLGNFAWLGPGSSPNDEPDRDTRKLFSKVREAIRKIDSGFVRRMEGDDGFSGYRDNVESSWREFQEEADYLAISSWCNFGLYGVDFGWGRPVWVTKCDSESDFDRMFPNVLWLMDTRGGDGVEAWMSLDSKYAEAFDGIEELRDLAKFRPSPFDVAGIVID